MQGLEERVRKSVVERGIDQEVSLRKIGEGVLKSFEAHPFGEAEPGNKRVDRSLVFQSAEDDQAEFSVPPGGKQGKGFDEMV